MMMQPASRAVKTCLSVRKNRLIFMLLTLGITSLSAAGNARAGLEDGARLNLEARNVYFNNDNRNAAKLQSSTQQWGQGFIVEGVSGYTDGLVGFGADAIGLQGTKLYGPDDRNGAIGMFPTRQSDGHAPDTFGSLRFALKARAGASALRAGYQQLDFPVIKSNDGRLLPSLYRGLTWSSRDIDNLLINAGYIDRIEGRNATHYQKLKATGNATQFSNQFYYTGLTWQPQGPLSLSSWYGELSDSYRQVFLGIKTRSAVGHGQIATDIRYFNSQDVGDSYAGHIDNDAVGGLVSYQQSGHTLGIGYQLLSHGSGFPYLDPGQSVDGDITNTAGGNAGLISDVPLSKFKFAGEQAWVIKYAWNLKRLGLDGVSLNATYVSGHHASATPTSVGENEWVRSAGLTWALPDRLVKGLSLAWRNVTYRSNVPGTHNQDQNMIILDYKITLAN